MSFFKITIHTPPKFTNTNPRKKYFFLFFIFREGSQGTNGYWDLFDVHPSVHKELRSLNI